MISKILILSVLFTSHSYAQSAADDLLGNLNGSTSKTSVKGAKTAQPQSINVRKLDDAFVRNLAVQIEVTDKISYDVRQWANQILNGDYKGASHLWTTLQTQIPEEFQNLAKTAYLYSLWKQNLNQTFFNQWIKSLAGKNLSQSAAEQALESVIAKDFDKWLLQNPVVLTPENEAVIAKLDSTKPLYLNLKAWAALRKPTQAEPLLAKLSFDNILGLYLGQTVALDYARKNNLMGAAKLLKTRQEPSLESFQGMDDVLTQHYLTVGRLLYQAGQLAGAQQFYEKIPRSSRYFLAAHEEMIWVLLRTGNTQRLRGEIETLSSPVFKDQFLPEMGVVKAITDLKFCMYDRVQKDIEEFSSINSVWAKKIDSALAAENPPEPQSSDFFSNLAKRSFDNIQAEKKTLEALAQESIAATLPAVGIQKHWAENLSQLTIASEKAQKKLSGEYRRIWKNQRAELNEAIRKMRFVKVEFSSQVRKLSRTENIGVAVADNQSVPVISKTQDQLSFPLEGAPWPDEFFKLYSAAQSRCLEKRGSR